MNALGRLNERREAMFRWRVSLTVSRLTSVQPGFAASIRVLSDSSELRHRDGDLVGHGFQRETCEDTDGGAPQMNFEETLK